jgi:phage tail sheath gpL-like
MTIAFNTTPNNIRIPFVSAEIDNSRAAQGAALLNYRGLIVGQKTAAGTAEDDSLHLVTSADQVGTLAGRNSMLYRQALKWFKNNLATEVWIGVLADDGAGVQATGTFAFAGTATEDGTVYAYLGDEVVTAGVASGDTASDVAAALDAAIDAKKADKPVEPSVAAGTVTVTFNHRGLVGNEYPLSLNYQMGQELPAGITCTVTQMSGGTTAPALTNLIAAMGAKWFQIIANPYTDATNLTAIETELASRFGPTRMIDGLAIASAPGTVSTLSALGNTRNSPHSIIIAQSGPTPVTPPFEFAAAVAAVTATSGSIDPARPFQTLPVLGVLPPLTEFDPIAERNVLMHNGIATAEEAAGGVVQLDRLITTYKTNAAGGADTSYLDATSLLTLMYLRFSFRAQIKQRYPRHKLASDGVRVGAGQPVITPIIGKSEALTWFRAMEELGLVEGFEKFKENLVVERNSQNVNRLDFLLPPDLMNQLIGVAANIQFLL